MLVRWEYLVVAKWVNDEPPLQDWLNTYGKQGWELVSLRILTQQRAETGYEAVFKRKVDL